MTDTASSSARFTAIAQDWPCIGCGYNLRGLDRTGVCPECATSIEQSLAARPLQRADVRWVRRIARGASGAAMATIAFLVVPTANARLALHLHGILRGAELARLSWPILMIVPFWLLRRPETPHDRANWPGRRLWALILAHLLVSVTISAILIVIIPLAPRSNIPWVPVLLGYAAEPFLLCIELWLMLGMLLLVTRRLPGRPMAVETERLRWAICTLLFLEASFLASVLLARLWWMAFRLWPPPVGFRWMPGSLGQLAGSAQWIVHMALVPAWLYLPFYLLRLQYKLRAGLMGCQGSERRACA